MLLILFIPLILFIALITYSQKEQLIGKRATVREIKVFFYSLLASLLIFLIISTFTSGGLKSNLFTLIFGSLTIIYWIIIFDLIIQKQRAGEILLDMGRFPSGPVGSLLGVLALLIYLYAAFLEKEIIFSSTSKQIHLFFQISLALFIIFSGLRRMLFTQTGFLWWNLIRYENIASYSWEYDKPNVLSLVLKKRIWFQKVISIPVPIQLKNTVKIILMGKVDSQNAS